MSYACSQGYSTENLGETQKAMLEDLRDYGLIWQKKVRFSRYPRNSGLMGGPFRRHLPEDFIRQGSQPRSRLRCRRFPLLTPLAPVLRPKAT